MAPPGMVVLFKEATLELDVDTFLTTVYCVVDDLYQAHYAYAGYIAHPAVGRPR